MSWLFLGAGNMGRSIIGGLLDAGVRAEHIAVVDPNEQACSALASQQGIIAAPTLVAAQQEMQQAGSPAPTGLIIAVKPAVVKTVCSAIVDSYEHTGTGTAALARPMVVSVAAGIGINPLESWLTPDFPIVRCMPNTPSLLGLGITALFANTRCTEEHKKSAQTLLNAVGKTLWVEDETQLDAVTALSGSGPAYIFYLIEQMIDAGVELGLAREMASKLAIETAFGAASMARTYENTPSVLRENVTSKGGTTAAALACFDEHGMPVIVATAMKAAQQRAVEIGQTVDS